MTVSHRHFELTQTDIILINKKFIVISKFLLKMLKRKHVDEDEEEVDLDTSERGYMSDEEGGVRIEDIYIPPPPKLTTNNHENGIRLIIHKIINTNFKSYGGTRVLGPFYKVSLSILT